jgi:hypothetical protein
LVEVELIITAKKGTNKKKEKMNKKMENKSKKEKE